MGTIASPTMPYDSGESIYSLIPPEVVVPVKPDRYRSTHNPKAMPTGSTFGQLGTTRLEGAALNGTGSDLDKTKTHAFKKGTATFGRTVGKPEPKSFLAKGAGIPQLPEAKNFSRSHEYKNAVPKRNEHPVMGQRSNKNFVTSNAVDNILRKPPAAKSSKADMHQSHGKVPAYLNKVKQEIADELQYIEKMQAASDPAPDGMRLLAEDERQELLMALKGKWEFTNKAYQEKSCLSLFSLDTIGKVKRKEEFERDLKMIEKDIERLSKKFVFVHE